MGAVALQDLNRGDEILSFTGDSFSASQQVIGGHVHNSSMIGWASKSLRTAKFLKFWTEGGRSVTVTPDHYLWVSPGSVLTAAKSVTEDMTLAFVSDTDGAVSWDKITCIHEEEEEGEFVPLIANIQAHEGDFVITDCGIVVPSYANLQVFRGYHAREAHELFQNILRSLGHLESSWTSHGWCRTLNLQLHCPSLFSISWRIAQGLRRRWRLPSCLSFRLRGTSSTQCERTQQIGSAQQ